jgi:ArsR family transcriptional regulator
LLGFNPQVARRQSPETLEALAARFRILGDPLRLRVLMELQNGERTVSELVDATDATQANISKHLALMSDAGVVARRKQGLYVYYRVADPGIYSVCDIMCGSLRALADQKAKALR